MRRMHWVLWVGALAWVAGCESETSEPADATATGTGDGTGTGSTTDTGSGTGGTSATGDTGTADTGAENACAGPSECKGGDACIEGVCLFAPVEEATLLDNRNDDVQDEAPNVGCINGNVTPPGSGPATTTIYGIVDRFGGGRKTVDIQVSVFLASEWPPAECTALDFDEQRGCFRDYPAAAGWSVISTDPEAANPTVPAQCSKHKDCPVGFECALVDVDRVCLPQYGLYQIPDVPTNTWLVIRGRNDESAALFDSKWKDTYLSGVYLYSDQVEADGRTNYNALMVSDSQWKTIPNTLFVAGGIKKGHGAVGGRIRDCRSDARPSFTIGWASVNLATPGSAIGYFNDNEEDTVPLVDRKGTDIFGRFTIVDVAPGPNKLAAAMNVGGSVTSLGAESFYLVPDSLSVVSLPGKLPILTK